MNDQEVKLTGGSQATYQDGSIELVVLGMLAALIVVLAVPLFFDYPDTAEKNLRSETEQQYRSESEK